MGSILVIDDDPAVLQMLRTALHRAGHQVLEACDVREAIRLQKSTPAEVVVTDILMPDADGLECIRELRRLDPGVRVIAISGGGRLKSADVLEMARRFGASRTFGKPLDIGELVAAIELELKARRAA